MRDKDVGCFYLKEDKSRSGGGRAQPAQLTNPLSSGSFLLFFTSPPPPSLTHTHSSLSLPILPSSSISSTLSLSRSIARLTPLAFDSNHRVQPSPPPPSSNFPELPHPSHPGPDDKDGSLSSFGESRNRRTYCYSFRSVSSVFSRSASFFFRRRKAATREGLGERRRGRVTSPSSLPLSRV